MEQFVEMKHFNGLNGTVEFFTASPKMFPFVSDIIKKICDFYNQEYNNAQQQKKSIDNIKTQLDTSMEDTWKLCAVTLIQ